MLDHTKKVLSSMIIATLEVCLSIVRRANTKEEAYRYIEDILKTYKQGTKHGT